MSWKAYRPGEGRWARLTAFVAILGLGAFAAYRWYLWADKTGLRGGLPRIGMYELTWAEVGAGILIVVFAMLGYRTCFASPGSSDFLIETEIELRKVTWPQWKPLFSSKAELWGSAYVVIAVVVALAVFVYAVDRALLFGSQRVFFR
jgi:preprotein translocase subunit SecE